MNQLNLKSLLNTSKNIVDAHLKATKEKGEDFNIFSVLGMEADETKTHSGMLVALLDPKGNHYHGTEFLELFLKEIKYDYRGENLNLVRVKAEHHLGVISKDFLTGGYVDILITFPSDSTIAIENKIYAGDQPKQMYRYSLFNTGKSTLYYLNLFGDNPSKDSLYKLTDEDYQIITYSNDILGWLNACLEVAKPGSIIETSLKQYQILLKKITHTMDNKLEDQFTNLIIENLEEAKYIHAHYKKAINKVREEFRLAVVEKLNSLELVVKARTDRDIDHRFSKIWLDSEALNGQDVHFGIEPFSGKGATGGRMFIGVLDKKREYDTIVDGDKRLNAYWPIVRELKTTAGNPLNLASTNVLEKLSNDDVYFKTIVNAIAEETQAFVASYHDYCSREEKLKVE